MTDLHKCNRTELTETDLPIAMFLNHLIKSDKIYTSVGCYNQLSCTVCTFLSSIIAILNQFATEDSTSFCTSLLLILLWDCPVLDYVCETSRVETTE